MELCAIGRKMVDKIKVRVIMGIKGYFMKETPQLMNMVNIQYTVIVPLGINKVFEFFINNNVSKYYPLMSKGHKYFTLREGERMEIGSIIDCEESAGNQTIKHEYYVAEIIKNERIH